MTDLNYLFPRESINFVLNLKIGPSLSRIRGFGKHSKGMTVQSLLSKSTQRLGIWSAGLIVSLSSSAFIAGCRSSSEPPTLKNPLLGIQDKNLNKNLDDISSAVTATLSQNSTYASKKALLAKFDRDDLISALKNTLKKTPETLLDRVHWEHAAQLLEDQGAPIPTDIAMSRRVNRLIATFAATSTIASINPSLDQIDRSMRILYRLSETGNNSESADSLRMIRLLTTRIDRFDREELSKVIEEYHEALLSSALAARTSRQQAAIVDLLGGFTPALIPLRTNNRISIKGDSVLYKTTGNTPEQWRILTRDDGSEIYLGVENLNDPGEFAERSFLSIQKFTLGESTLDSLIEDAKKRRKQELTCASDYDLKEKGEILYLPIFHKGYDQVLESNLLSTILLGKSLAIKYGNRVKTFSPEFVDDAPEFIQSWCANRGDLNGKTIVLDLTAHGFSAGVAFSKTITAEGLIALSRKYPDTHFLVFTIACHGGGLRDKILNACKTDAKLSENLALVVESPVTDCTWLCAAKDVDCDRFFRYLPPPFRTAFCKSLLDPGVKTFSEVVRKADEESKTKGLNDAEAILKGKAYSQAMENTNPSERLILQLLPPKSPPT